MEIIGVIAVIVAFVVIDGMRQRLSRRHAAARQDAAGGSLRQSSDRPIFPPPFPSSVAVESRHQPSQPLELRAEAGYASPTSLAEEGIRVTTDDEPVATDTEVASVVAAMSDDDWRKAVIYNEILKTKF
ncbi:MAG: hypothetical protein NC117_08905 [Pseudoflavonifractor sp.]|nr:hypothetical protein [Pseudoflavonifractor sp.]